MSLCLLLSWSPPQPIAAQSAKIHPDVLEAMASSDFVQILIKLPEQVNLEASARGAGLPQGMSSPPEKLAARQGVLDKLQATAAVSQEQLLIYLETAAKAGLARDIQSFYIVNIIYAEVHPSLVRTLARRSDVDRLLPNSRISQEDTNASATQISSGSQWNIQGIGAEALHDLGHSGNGVVVGIIDTGVDWNHPDLRTSWRGTLSDPVFSWFDVVAGRGLPYDDDGHGTHVAGIILGGSGTGVAPDAQWIAVKAFDEFGDANSAWLLEAGQYMLAPLDAQGIPRPHMAPDIINNSWGQDSGLDEWYRPMVQAWRAAGILPVFASGNVTGPESIYNPANYPESLAVAAIGLDNKLSPFSAAGPPPYSGIFKPDLSAPGENIRSTRAGGGYGIMSGTSVAAPHVSGAAALLLSSNPSLSIDILEAVLKQTAAPLTDAKYTSSPNHGFGHGRVNVLEALTILEGAGFIRGRVTAEITGVSPPAIQHTPVHEYYTDISLPVIATIQDQVGVARAEVTLEAGNFPMELLDGDAKAGSWIAWIPYDRLNSAFDYSIQATNRAGVKSVNGPHLTQLVPGVTPPFSQDLASFPLGWTWDGEWAWGYPGGKSPQSPQGTALFGTGLSTNYSANSWSTLYVPPLDLRSVTGAALHIEHWFELGAKDSAQVFISDDNFESWQVLEIFEGKSPGWTTLSLDLSPWDGWDIPIILGFDLISDEKAGGGPGWFIDGIHLEGHGLDTQTLGVTQSISTNETTTGQLPLEAVITIVETGRSVGTGYADGIFAGSFVLIHPPSGEGTFTLRVEARGYHTLEQQVTLGPGETLDLELSLEALDFSFQRLSGNNRFSTAAAISQEGWDSTEVVILARGDDYADALAGVPLAHAHNAPVLLTAPDRLPQETRDELVRLGAEKVVILGGTGAISQGVEDILVRELALEVERISGLNRYATAAEIARRLQTMTGADQAIIAVGNNFPDALTAAPQAASHGLPILLTQRDSLPGDTAAVLNELGISKTLIIGGTGAVGETVAELLPQPQRLEGINRYFTAVAVAEHFQPPSSRLYLATGRDFADAICGAALAARDNAALLLVGDTVPRPVSQYILAKGTDQIVLLGGKAAVPESIMDAIKSLAPQ